MLFLTNFFLEIFIFNVFKGTPGKKMAENDIIRKHAKKGFKKGSKKDLKSGGVY